MFIGERWRHGAPSREMVAWRRERSAIDATVTEVVSETSRLEVTYVRVGRMKEWPGWEEDGTAFLTTDTVAPILAEL